eukprot:2557553-Prymnesium_polylepis.1
MVKCEDPKIVEAPSSRSKCQTCGEHIEHFSMRIGMPARHNGITVTKWVHPACFVRHNLRCDYAPTDRAHCSGDGSLIGKGEPRIVMFRKRGPGVETGSGSVVHQKVYKPPNAAPFLSDLLALPGVDMSLDDIEGLDTLETAHREWVVAALEDRAVGPAPVHAAIKHDALKKPQPVVPIQSATTVRPHGCQKGEGTYNRSGSIP